jgi:hypothetical protein
VKRAVVAAALFALLAVPAAHADGDPASDILINDNVFLALVSPQTSAKGRELEALTASAAKEGFVLKAAVVRAPTELGAVPQLYGQAKKYAKFLRTELTWLGFKGTLIVVMNGSPGGAAVVGPGATAAEARVSRLNAPPNATVDQLADVAIRAVHVVAAANNVSVSAPPSNDNHTRDRLVIGAALVALIALALIASRKSRTIRG